MTLSTLSLCSGIGGLELGLLIAGVDHRPVAWVESDPTCQDVLPSVVALAWRTLTS